MTNLYREGVAMDSFSVIFNQLFQFLIMMICGYVAARKGIVAEAHLTVLTRIIIKLLLPILIFANAVEGTTRQIIWDCKDMIILSILLYGGLIIVQAIAARLLGLSGNIRRIYQATMVFGNVGFLGIPLLSAAFPGYGGIYVALFSIVDQIVLWTYGIFLTTPKEESATFQWKRFLNPAVYAITLAIVLILAGISLPTLLSQSLLTVGRSATPMALIYLGALLYYSDWKFIIKSKELYVGIALKMLIFPLVFFAITSQLFEDMQMVKAVTLIAGLPTMTAIAMLAQSKHNHEDYALGMILVTTLASLVTMTIVSYLVF